MKIGINAMQVRAAKSGVGQYIHALVEEMLRQDHLDSFELYCNGANAPNYKFDAPNYSTRVWGLSGKRAALRLSYELAFLPGDVARQGFSVFHGPSNFLPRRKVCPYVVTIQDLSYHVDPQRCPPLRRKYWYAMTKRTIALADAIITPSENSQRDIVRFFPSAEDRTTVIPLAAHKRFRRVGYGREKSMLAAQGIRDPYILFVGTLEPGKNVVRLLDAFEAIAGTFPRHRLLIVGDKGWMYEPIFAAAAESRFRDRIDILGHLPDAEIVDYLNFCDAFVFPSLYEGFGLPPLEAMACGAPVITSTTSSLPEVVGDAALTVDPMSVDEIARAMRRVLEDEQLRDELREKGIARAAKFSWAQTAAATLRVYEKTAQNG